MRYAELCDLQNVFGADNVRSWSNLDNTDVNVNTARVDYALDWASAYIDSRLRQSRYAVPLTDAAGLIPLQVTDWTACLAAWKLYTARGLRDEGDPTGDKMTVHKSRVEGELDALLAGRLELDANLSTPPNSTGPVVA